MSLLIADADDSKEPPAEKPYNHEVVSTQVGIWQFLALKDKGWNPRLTVYLTEIASAYAFFRRLFFEIYDTAPGLLSLYILSKIWNGIESALLLHMSSRLLQIVEVGLKDGRVDAYAIFMAVVARLSCVIVVTLFQWWCEQVLPGLKTRIIHHYKVYLMRIRLRLDLAAAQEQDRISNVSPTDGWRAFDAIFTFFSEILASSSQLYFIFYASRSSGGPIFTILSLARPMIKVFFAKNIWSKGWIIYGNNPHHQRMNALSRLSGDRYKQDYIAGNIANHILQEYEKANEKLGDTCADDWYEQLGKQTSPYFDILCDICSDLPIIYCAANAIVNPSMFSVASIAVLQHSAISLRSSISQIHQLVKSFQRHVSNLQNLYGISEVKIKLKEGDLAYPSPNSSPLGMSLELRNLTFSYPGAKKTTNALNEASLSIKPGQLVVIVGSNGSGKSTIIKLLSRLYDPTSGVLLIDGVPASQYLASDLRPATASFTQDHKLYPLSLYENIGLGDPEQLNDEKLVAEAAELGGVAEFVGKLEEGLRTVLEPCHDVHPINVPPDMDHPLQRKLQMLEKELDISGGEQQRVIASRTFMHLNSGRVKFVAVDEPSSALDAEGEAKLFERLLQAREGKTMVFMTHRFAHLTKFADVILCLKDGMIVELGTHDELIKLGGEYAKLYDIQANAFHGDDLKAVPLNDNMSS